MKSPYLVCYDITDDRRLHRVFNYMKAQGMHLQYSVFYCELTWHELEGLKKDLSTLIDHSSDDIRIYPLQKDSLVAVLGCGGRVPEGVELVL